MPNFEDIKSDMRYKIYKVGYSGFNNLSVAIREMLRIASMAELELQEIKFEGEKQQIELFNFQEKLTSMVQEVDYEPSIVDLKKCLKHEKNFMRQKQLRQQIAKLEFKQRRK